MHSFKGHDDLYNNTQIDLFTNKIKHFNFICYAKIPVILHGGSKFGRGSTLSEI